MTHIYARSIVVVGLLLMMFAVSQLVNAGRTYSASGPIPEKFLVAPEGTVFHAAGCKHIDPSQRNMVVTLTEAERCKFTPCEHCLRRESGTWRTSQASRRPGPTGTPRLPSRESGH